MDITMTNELSLRNNTEIQPMSADRRVANLEALLSSLSDNTRAQINSTWNKLYVTWCKSGGIDVWQLDAVQAIAFFTAHPTGAAVPSAHGLGFKCRHQWRCQPPI
jgi:hypothetical protein